jgi:hypothetical protein
MLACTAKCYKLDIFEPYPNLTTPKPHTIIFTKMLKNTSE